MARSLFSDGEKMRFLQLQRRSGKTVADFCAEIGISPPAFYTWKRKLGEQPAPRAPSAAKRDGAATSARVNLPANLDLGFCDELFRFLDETALPARRFRLVWEEAGCYLEGV